MTGTNALMLRTETAVWRQTALSPKVSAAVAVRETPGRRRWRREARKKSGDVGGAKVAPAMAAVLRVATPCGVVPLRACSSLKRGVAGGPLGSNERRASAGGPGDGVVGDGLGSGIHLHA